MELLTRLNGGDSFDIEEVEVVVRATLRELIWCGLSDQEGKRQVHFGYDYYMYFGPIPIPVEVENKVREIGLYIN